MTDPVADLIALERRTREASARHGRAKARLATFRRDLLNRLHQELGTWQKVADATGQKLPTVHKAAKQPKRGSTP